MMRKNKGSTTVFLCLISVIIIMVISALFADIRRTFSEAFVKRNTDIATEAEFSRYYRPLFDKYRLFYYVETDNNLLEAGIMGYFLQNQKKIPDVLKVWPACIEIQEKEYAAKKEVKNVKEQMTESIKYVLSESAIESILAANKKVSGNSEQVNDTLNQVKEGIDSSKNAAVLEEKVLKLLELVEGIKIASGKVTCTGTFVKMGIFGKVNSVNAGIASDIVWEKVNPYMVDMSKLFDESDKNRKELEEVLNKISEKTNEAVKVVESIRTCPGFDNSTIICDVNAFANLLEDNVSVIKELISFLEMPGPVSDCKKLMEKYHVKELSFDYSSLHTKEAEDPREQMQENVDGILSFLVKAPEDISKKKINESDIYKNLMEADAEIEKDDNDSSGFLSDTESLGKFVEECANQQAGEIGKGSLTGVYLNHFFDSYVNSNERKKEDKDFKKVLDYEIEYIICGKESDEANLKSVVKKLLLLRTGMSLAYLVTDKQKSELAYMTAAAIVGFTGMDALVRTIQYAILAGWAYEDACVDVGTLLGGKKIAVAKNASSLNVSYKELVMFNKEMLLEKIEAMNTTGGIDYETAMWLLLAAGKENNKIYRAMDLIELNMKKNCSKRFTFQKALYKAKVHIVCDKPYEQDGFSIFEYE